MIRKTLYSDDDNDWRMRMCVLQKELNECVRMECNQLMEFWLCMWSAWPMRCLTYQHKHIHNASLCGSTSDRIQINGDNRSLTMHTYFRWAHRRMINVQTQLMHFYCPLSSDIMHKIKSRNDWIVGHRNECGWEWFSGICFVFWSFILQMRLNCIQCGAFEWNKLPGHWNLQLLCKTNMKTRQQKEKNVYFVTLGFIENQ